MLIVNSHYLLTGSSMLTLASLLEEMLLCAAIRRVYLTRMLPTVLHGYLSLRRLLMQRTKHLEDTEAIFLKIIEELAKGTEDDVRHLTEVSAPQHQGC